MGTSAWLFSHLSFRLQLIHSMPFLGGFPTFELLRCRGSTVESERHRQSHRLEKGKNDKGLKLYDPGILIRLLYNRQFDRCVINFDVWKLTIRKSVGRLGFRYFIAFSCTTRNIDTAA
ncbi:unnamed protein product [Fraxinus pennsylvanica]|uniref:Uncharacterized protein n=1 Tax=Fraxinus pennsylvanica TaxID=56036 RepID=A0AAD2AG14_9LAMI|nr:unnamed protein product [Fraxinus pennsylvanica]